MLNLRFEGYCSALNSAELYYGLGTSPHLSEINSLLGNRTQDDAGIEAKLVTKALSRVVKRDVGSIIGASMILHVGTRRPPAKSQLLHVAVSLAPTSAKLLRSWGHFFVIYLRSTSF